jgi:multidrug efflux pump subunit AcrB
MQGLITWFSHNNIAANLLTLAIIIFGIFSIPQTSKEFFPGADVDTVRINIPYPGAAPINVEEQVCIRVEQAIEGIEGIDRITSNAMQNLCQVDVEAEDNYDIPTLLADIKNKVDAIIGLPVDAETPQVYEQTIPFEMMQLALTGEANIDEKTLKRHAQKIKKELEALAHVSTVIVDGTRDYEIAIELDQSQLRRYNLSFEEVRLAISSNSIDLPVGSLSTAQGDILLQTRKQATDSQSLGNIIIRKDNNGAIIRLADIATIDDGFVEDAVISHYNGKPSVFFKVQVTANPDVIKTHHEVSEYLGEKVKELPSNLELTIWYSFYDSFIDRINTLVTNGASGLLLVFIVLMLFLRPLLSLWVCIGIGIAFLGALWLMPVIGTSLNMISLFAFLMILGIVVDDAIIVAESVYDEQEKHGPGLASAQKGTIKVYRPVLFAVISTMIVFVPMLLLPGNSAKASQAIPTVVLLVLTFSLIECLLILPSHLADMPREGYFTNPFIKNFDKVRKIFSAQMDNFIHKYYSPLLNLCVNHYGSAIASFIVAMAISLAIFAGGWMSFSFLPQVDTDHIRVQVDLPEGEPDQLAAKIAAKIQQASDEMQAQIKFSGTDVSQIKNTYVRTYSKTVFAAIGLNRDYKQEVSSPELIQLWREKIGEIPEAENIEFFYQINNQGKPLQYSLASENNESLKQASQLMKEYLAEFPGVYNISDTLQTPRSEIELDLNASSQFAAWDINTLSQQLRSAFYGQEVQRIPRDEEDIRIMLRLSEQERSQHESINSLPVRDKEGNLTRIDAISSTQYVPALQEIKRINRKRTVVVSADLLKGTTEILEISNAVLEDFAQELQQKIPGVEIYIEGEEQERREFMSAWGLLFAQAMLAIYAMMAIAFRSYWQPVIILTAIPFGVMGAIFGHLIMGKDISIFSFLGVMACAGVVVNDNLVLIDRINQLREQGYKIKEALVQAGKDRFRPIILTSATTFIGLLPIMSETSLQAQFLIPMVISLAFGVLFATTVTLLLVPSLYLLGERFKERAGGLVSHLKLKYNR